MVSRYITSPGRTARCPHSPPLEHDHGVRAQVPQLQLASLLQDVGVLPHQQPADVREEEPPQGVVRVGVRLRVLVVHAVVPRPLVDVVLRERDGTLTWHQD